MVTQKAKTYVLRFRSVNRNTFSLIKDGKKRVETRAATVRYLPIKKNDTLLFVCGKNSFKKKIKKVVHFTSVNTLLKKYTPEDIHPGIGGVTQLKAMYASFPGYTEKIKEHGILAFVLSD